MNASETDKKALSHQGLGVDQNGMSSSKSIGGSL